MTIHVVRLKHNYKYTSTPDKSILMQSIEIAKFCG